MMNSLHKRVRYTEKVYVSGGSEETKSGLVTSRCPLGGMRGASSPLPLPLFVRLILEGL